MDTLYIMTRYVVLWHTSDQRISTERVQANHTALNLAFSHTNDADNAKIPDTEHYPWASLVGTPNVQFLPIDSSQVQPSYLQVNNTSFSGVTQASQAGGVVNGLLNIYIGPSNGSLLGQAGGLGSNILFVDFETVGYGDHPGTLANYIQGKALVHEVGHCLSLPHTFADVTCDEDPVYPDVPIQINPNFFTVLFETSPGTWDCKNDNRYLDRIDDQGRSCFSEFPSDVRNEMGVNFMDYGNDGAAILFTASQTEMMRSFAVSPGNTSMTIYATSDVTPTVTPTDTSQTSESNLGLIIGLSVGAGVLVVVLIIAVVLARAHRPTAAQYS